MSEAHPCGHYNDEVQQYMYASQFVHAETLAEAERIRDGLSKERQRNPRKTKYTGCTEADKVGGAPTRPHPPPPGYAHTARATPLATPHQAAKIAEARRKGRAAGSAAFTNAFIMRAREKYNAAEAVPYIEDVAKRRRLRRRLRRKGKDLYMYGRNDPEQTTKLIVNPNGSTRPLPNPDAPGTMFRGV